MNRKQTHAASQETALGKIERQTDVSYIYFTDWNTESSSMCILICKTCTVELKLSTYKNGKSPGRFKKAQSDGTAILRKRRFEVLNQLNTNIKML